MDLLLVTVTGVAYGVAVLVLVALGLAVIFGMMGVLNLAQGEFLMLGAYTVLVVASLGGSVWLGILLAPLVVGMIGLLVERTIIQFLYGRPLDTMLATWGLSLALVGIVTLLMGPATAGVATPLSFVSIGAYNVSIYRLVVIAAALGLLVFTYVLFNRTRAGVLARATMQNPTMVAAFGVEPRLVYLATFAYGSALAGLAGAIMAPLTGVVPSLGLAFIAKIFITVIVGGPLILLGTSTAAAVLGTAESTVAYMSTPIYGQVAMLGLALVILRLFPDGLSGLWRPRSIGRGEIAAFGVAALLIAILPSVVGPFQVVQLTVFLIYGMLALSLDLIWGVAGILSFGQAALFGIGGYVYGIVAINTGLPFLGLARRHRRGSRGGGGARLCELLRPHRADVFRRDHADRGTDPPPGDGQYRRPEIRHRRGPARRL